MTLNQLKYFQTVASLENYHKSAEKLFVSQPSLSRSIMNLEKELGVELFQKKGRRIVLTKAGMLFLEYTNRILDDCEIATNKMMKMRADGGKIDIGYVFPLAGSYMPHMVRLFLNEEDNGNIIFGFHQGDSNDLINKVKSGELDIGFGGYARQDSELEFYPILRHQMVIITPKEHPLNDGPVSIRDIEKYPVIGYNRRSWLGRFTIDTYFNHKLKPNIIVECPDEYSIMALVGEAFGIALIPNVDFLDQSRVNIHPISDMDLYYHNYMFWMKDRYHLPAEKRFIEFMKKHVCD